MRIKPGDIRQRDSQADIWQTSYKVIEKADGPGKWVIEQLPPSDEVINKVIDLYAAHEDRCHKGCTTCTYHTPIWDKTWSECDKTDPEDYPRRIGWTTAEQHMMAEIARLHEWAGERTTIRFVSSAEYARHF